jgi:arylsulfatase A-like enzyme
MFTDYYGEESCTAGRSSFVTGQSVFRTGLSKVGLPGAKEGLQKEDPTIAEVLKGQGYATGEFGKSHLGDRDERLLEGHQIGDMTYKLHFDGYSFLPHFKGEVEEGPREEVFYFTDDGALSALRYNDWKMLFLQQRVMGPLEIWANPFTELRVPMIFNLQRDPYERAFFTSNTHYDWLIDRVYMLVPAQA